MNILDSMIGFFSPEAGYRRSLFREELKGLKRHGYDAGNGARLNKNWGALIESAEMTDRCSRDTIRGRARDLERNSDILNSIISAFIRNVVGSGFSLQAKTGNEKINTEIEKLFKEWSKPKNCDVSAQQSFTQILRMAVRRKKIDGGILFKKCYTAGGLVPFKLQALEVDELAYTWGQPRDPQNKVAGGIEYDQFNKPVGYWLTHYSVDGLELSEPEYYNAKDIIFIYSKNRPSQVREISDLAPTLTRVRDTNEFITAVAIKERIAACLSVFIKKAIPLTSYGRSGVNNGNTVDYSQRRLAPGMITEMNAGDDIQVVDPKSSSADATSFLKLQQRLIGAGQGLSYEATARDMSECTYSSARQANIEDELTYLEDKEVLIRFMDEVLEAFIVSAIMAKKLIIPDFWDNKEQYFNHIWVSSPKKWIDPQKEANAQSTALTNGLKTFAQIAAEGGRDWREQIDEMSEIIKYAKAKGVNLPGYNIQSETETETSSSDENEDQETETAQETNDNDNQE